ncbi:ABC transporter ATP-binding protein [Acholeplasma granularum]|uniref:ABC transporter ATP-binding protein n=1 Tax=Acholeplasma granularum TaxID=264635 RepID=UPI000470A007|nr:ABC transporter ATP-binding protein [Acholeplasma granularum]
MNIKPKMKRSETLKRLLKMVFIPNKFKIVLVVIFMMIATFANVMGLSSLQNVLDESLSLFESGSPDFSGVTKLLLLMAFYYVTNITFTFIQLRMMVNISQDSLVNLRTTLFNHMIDLPLSYFDTNKHGDIMSRYTNDIDATRQMIAQSLPQMLAAGLLLIGYFIAMVYTSWILSIFTLIFTMILLYTTKKIIKKSRRYFIEQQQNVGRLNGYIEEMIEGQKVIKVFRHEKEVVEGFSKINNDVKNSARISMSRSGMLIPISINLGFLGFAIIAILGGILVLNNQLGVSSLVLYLIFTRQFMGPLNQIGQQFNFVQMALAGASRVFEVLDMEKEVDLGTTTLVYVKEDDNKKLIETNEKTNKQAWKTKDGLILLKGDVRLENVDFGYTKNKKVLKNISVFAKPGQKIAFVGSTGAGKTTITNLINRFYEIDEGVITFDGVDIKTIKKSALRSALAIVLQDTHLFQTTVKENIRYGKLDATDEEVIAAAKLANAHEFIMKLPNGYDTLITDDGSNLSQGQRQLLSIARAAISNPPVLILDEATSSIDTYTEKLIQDGMDKLMDGRTVFVIAHRLSTIRNSKAIILLENGYVKERGNHEDLIDLKGVYFELFTGAFELE